MIRQAKFFLKTIILPKYIYLRRFAVKQGDLVIDLGANVGEVTEYFLSKGAHVHAYEPNPYAFAVLERRVGGRKNARLFQAAVSNYEGESQLWLHKDHEGDEVTFSQSGSLQKEKNNVSGDAVKVPVADIAGVLAIAERIKLLKIDIEGGEYDIIDGVLACADKIDYVLLETHGSKSPAFAEKEIVLQQKIAASPHRDKFFTDWF